MQHFPEFKWCDVPAGTVKLEHTSEIYHVEPFFISRYPVAWAQYRAFREGPDGYRDPRWWVDLYSDDQPGEQYRKVDNYPAERQCCNFGVSNAGRVVR
jgi:formylglycine-generating enzyme required for sulfatase activity